MGALNTIANLRRIKKKHLSSQNSNANYYAECYGYSLRSSLELDLLSSPRL